MTELVGFPAICALTAMIISNLRFALAFEKCRVTRTVEELW
jgi:hypothetical protein